MEDKFIITKEVEEKNNQIILELALQINKELLIENKISYKAFKTVEESLLGKLN